jgi:hypothetical protein
MDWRKHGSLFVDAYRHEEACSSPAVEMEHSSDDHEPLQTDSFQFAGEYAPLG